MKHLMRLALLVAFALVCATEGRSQEASNPKLVSDSPAAIPAQSSSESSPMSPESSSQSFAAVEVESPVRLSSESPQPEAKLDSRAAPKTASKSATQTPAQPVGHLASDSPAPLAKPSKSQTDGAGEDKPAAENVDSQEPR